MIAIPGTSAHDTFDLKQMSRIEFRYQFNIYDSVGTCAKNEIAIINEVIMAADSLVETAQAWFYGSHGNASQSRFRA